MPIRRFGRAAKSSGNHLAGARLEEPVDIAALVRELIVDLDAGARLGLRALTGPVVAGDRAALKRAFWEVLVHALAHDAPRGFVRVTIGEVGAGVFVEVQGPELDPEREQERNADRAPARRAGATSASRALSMSVARAVVEAHGGGLRFIEDVERLLLIYLPLARAAWRANARPLARAAWRANARPLARRRVARHARRLARSAFTKPRRPECATAAPSPSPLGCFP